MSACPQAAAQVILAHRRWLSLCFGKPAGPIEHRRVALAAYAIPRNRHLVNRRDLLVHRQAEGTQVEVPRDKPFAGLADTRACFDTMVYSAALVLLPQICNQRVQRIKWWQLVRFGPQVHHFEYLSYVWCAVGHALWVESKWTKCPSKWFVYAHLTLCDAIETEITSC